MINVNTVYKSVLSILNKEQRGYLTPDEFNKNAKIAQMNLLEIAFAEYNRFLSMDALGRINAGYADLPERIKEKIEAFSKSKTIINYGLPTDIYKLIDISLLDKTISLEEIDKNELAYILSSPLTEPSKEFPVYYKSQTDDGKTLIVVKPTLTDTLTVDYIKIPTAPRFGYTVNPTYGTNTYDSRIFVDTGLVQGIHDIGIVSTNRTDITTSQVYTLQVDVTAGVTSSGVGSKAIIKVTVSNNTISAIEVTSPGSGFVVGEQIIIAPNAIPNTASGSMVLTVRNADLYNTTTLGSTNFELHPSEENVLIMSILGLAGVTIKDQGLVTLTSQALQSQSKLKAQ